MALGLVGRTVRALSDHLNAYYRVFKGVDPDNVYVRLPTSGSFEVRHSQSNLPVLRVTDAGANGSVSIPAGSITSTELADGTVDTADLKDGAVSSAKILDGTIMNADVNAAAAIVVSKLAAGGTADRLVGTHDGVTVGLIVPRSAAIGGSAGTPNTLLRSDGTNSGWNKVQPTDLSVPPAANQVLVGTGPSAWTFRAVQANDTNVAAAAAANTVLKGTGANAWTFGQVAAAEIGANVITNAQIAAGTITTTEIADNTIVNADVNPAAGIVVSKLAHVGAGNVLRSNGTTNVAGQVATGDMAANTINGDRILDNTITSAKLSGGIAVPAGSITTAEIADGTIMNADVNAAAGIVVSKLAAGGTADRLVGTADGTTMGLAIPRAAALGGAAGTANTVLRTDGTLTGWNKIQPADLSVTPAANTVLRGTGASSWAFGAVQAADIGANVITNGQIAAGTIRSTEIADGTIATADMAAAAATGYWAVSVIPPGFSGTGQTPITGATLTVTSTGAGPMLFGVSMSSMYASAGAGNLTVQVWEGAAAVHTVGVITLNGTDTRLLSKVFIMSPSGSAGSPVAHTFFVAWACGGGLTVAASDCVFWAMEVKR